MGFPFIQKYVCYSLTYTCLLLIRNMMYLAKNTNVFWSYYLM